MKPVWIPRANWFLLALYVRKKASCTFKDAHRALKGDSGLASWVLFMLTELGRLVRNEDGTYGVFRSDPITDTCWSGYQEENRKILQEVRGKAAEKRSTREEEKKRSLTSRASVTTGTMVNEDGRDQDCTFAACLDGDGETEAWGISDRSAKRALTELTSVCSCGADWHEEE